MIDRAYKCRMYPNREQTAQIERTLGSCRWVWNHALEVKHDAYKATKRSLSSYELMKLITMWKRTVSPWLVEADSQALQQTIRNLDQAYKNFFRRVKKGEKPYGYPKPKKRAGRESYRTPAANGKVKVIDDRHVKVPKLGVVKVRGLQKVEGRMLNATIERAPSGKYFLSLCCTDVPEPEMPTGSVDMMGIDLGVGDDLLIRSDGVKVENNRRLRSAEKRLKRAQRSLSRREKGSANYRKQRLKVARLHEKVANQRRDDLHKATTQAVRDAKAVSIETLNVKGMEQNHHLAKSVADASMYEMSRQLQYKCGWYGRDFVKVDRWFPSTQTCSCCGAVVGPKGFGGLHDRDWTCPSCGAHHDRDVNAAKNIAREGQRMLESQGV